MERVLSTIILLCFNPGILLGQSSSPAWEDTDPDSSASSSEFGVTREVQHAFEELSDEASGNAEADRLLRMSDKPFDLNSVSEAELESLPGVTPAEAGEVVKLRALLRKFVSLRQLAAIRGDDELLLKIAPFVTVEGNGSGRKSPLPYTLSLITRNTLSLQPRKGFLDGSFSGSRLKTFNRLSFRNVRGVDCSFLYEKDEGERYSEGFVSGFVSTEAMLPGLKIVLGDYAVEAGQGLVLWRQSSLGKTAAVSNPRKSALGVRPYCTPGESNFFRGFAATMNVDFGHGEMGFSMFVSVRSLSGSQDSSGNLTGIYQAGLYRTGQELAKRNVAGERAGGCAVRFCSPGGWELGVSFLLSQLDKSALPSDIYAFAGRVNNILGLNAGFSLERINLFAEAAISRRRAPAGVIGALFGFGLQSTLSMVYRYYSPEFQNIRAQGFGERGESNNERGLFVGMQLPFGKLLRLSGYLDQFKFPWPTYFNPFPTSGREIRLDAEREFPRRFDIAIAYRNDKREATEEIVDMLSGSSRQIYERIQQSVRVTVRKRVSAWLTVSGRIEVTELSASRSNRAERGLLLTQSMQYHSGKISAETRLTFFDTYSYESRLYAYESDLTGVFSNPPLSGRGQRWYLVIRWSPSPVFKLSAKYAETRLEAARSIGTGPMEILGDLDNRFAVQMELKM